MKNTKKMRNSNIELLRIISMLMILFHHYVLYGVMQSYDENVSYAIYSQGNMWQKMIVQLLLPGGVIGVNIFFIIMGYFGVDSSKIHIAKVVQETVVYSVFGLIIYLVFGMICGNYYNYSTKEMLTSIIPICCGLYWFISVYVIISIMKATINKLILTLHGKQLLMLIPCVICYYIIARYNSDYALYLGLVQGLIMYFIGASINLNIGWLRNKKRLTWVSIGLLGWLGYMLLSNVKWLGINKLNGLFAAIGICVFGTISAFGIFTLFISRNPFYSNKVNSLGVSSFAVYLIHEHKFLRYIIWSKFLSVESVQYNSKFFALFALLSVLIIYMICFFIDKLFKNTVFKLTANYINKIKKIFMGEK